MKEKRIGDYIPEGEELLYSGGAKENDYISVKFINVFPVILLWLAAECVILGVAIANSFFGQEFNVYYTVLTVAAIFLHLVPTSVWLTAVARENFRLRGEEYAVTDKRIIIRHGRLHESAEIIENADVCEIFMKRSLGELITGTGRIIFVTDEEKIIFYSVPDAYKAFKKIYRAVLKGRNTDD